MKLSKPTPTRAFDTYWAFAAERQDIFFRRAAALPPPWTHDPILQTYRFTNAYRASDRVSQYLLRNVVRIGSQEPEELFFRVILFKTFNKIETWDYFQRKIGCPVWSEFSIDRYSDLLDAARSSGATIYSAAYIMPPGEKSFGSASKHRNHLQLLELMMRDGVPDRIQSIGSLEGAYNVLLRYPTIGPFLAYQYAIDLNYAGLTDSDENSFVVPGPGAKRGIKKCFSDPGDYSEPDLIKFVTESQEREFHRRDRRFQTLWGRPLHLIDCQNLFCELDKYARVAHPELNRRPCRIKRQFFANTEPISYNFPDRWGINGLAGAWSSEKPRSACTVKHGAL